MANRKLSIPRRRVDIYISIDLWAKLDLQLFSDTEGRVPYGEYSNFFETRLRDYFESDYLLLAPFGIEGMVKGPSGVIEMLKKMLEQQSRQLKEAEANVFS